MRTEDPGTSDYSTFINDVSTECFVHERYRDSAGGHAHSASISLLMQEFLKV